MGNKTSRSSGNARDTNIQAGVGIRQMAEAPLRMLVVGIDFGTSFSGYAFQFRHEHESDCTKANIKIWRSKIGLLASMKAPTSILLKPDQTFHSFGYDAENKYSELAGNREHWNWYFFKQFKMKLYDQIGLKRDIKLEDATGKSLPALTVFQHGIKFLRDDVIKECKSKLSGFKEEEIHWVLTTPAIWSEAANQFMREAAVKAGIGGKSLDIALEPEAASVYCKYVYVKQERAKDKDGLEVIESFKPGTKYFVLDAGGGTVDITVHEIRADRSVKEIHHANGGPWGSTMVDEEFRMLLTKITGAEVLTTFQKDYMEDYLELTREFERKKRQITMESDDKVTFRFPSALRELFETKTDEKIAEAITQMPIKDSVRYRQDKIQLSASMMRKFFENPVSKIIKHLSNLTKEPGMADIRHMLMVGGFSESKVLQHAVQGAFREMKVLIPQDADAAVLRGAVIFGHKPTSIVERKSKYTYGIAINKKFKSDQHDAKFLIIINGEEYCKNNFEKHVVIGESLYVGEWQAEQNYSQSDGYGKTTIPIYATTEKTPKYTTDPSCVYLGELTLPTPTPKGKEMARVSVKMCYSGTELKVEAKNIDSGEIVDGSFNFLE
ncbi:hypothetical protein ScPMuIL_010000 [Solemya velum]